MRTIRTKVYKFNELNETAKQKAIESNYDINVMFGDWYESLYMDAENIGLKITGFDIDGGNYCKGEFNLSASEVAANIFRDHGEGCSTYKTASAYMEEFNPVFSEYMNEDSDKYESVESEWKLQDMEDEFLKSLCEDYRIMLRNDYDYNTSKDVIIETIEANEYEFTKEGNRF